MRRVNYKVQESVEKFANEYKRQSKYNEELISDKNWEVLSFLCSWFRKENESIRLNGTGCKEKPQGLHQREKTSLILLCLSFPR